MISMIDLQKARRVYAEKLATELPQPTRDFLEAADALALRMLRCEPPLNNDERSELNRLLVRAVKNAK